MNFDPKNRQHQLLLVTVVVVGLFLGDKIIRAPLWKAWNNRSTELRELKDEVTRGESLIQSADALNSRWSQMRTNALPADTAAAESLILGAFDRWSRTSRVSVSSIRPQWKRGDNEYMTLECRAEISGNLSELTRLLYEIENDPMGVKVDTATFTTRDTDGAQIALTLQVSGLQLLAKTQPTP